MSTTADDELRLLLVEDSEEDAELLCLELGRAGYVCDVLRVDTASELEAALDDEGWDLIISDFQMPTFDGLAAFRMYQERGLDIPFIFVSGVLGEERAVEAMKAGARDYLLKGQIGRLAAAVERELEAARDRRREREAQDAARVEQRRLAMAVETTGFGIFEQTVPLGSIYVSPRCASIFGYHGEELSQAQLEPSFIEQHVHADDMSLLRETYARLLDGTIGRMELELRALDRNGVPVQVAVHAKAIEKNAAGSARKVVGVIRDVSDSHRLEQQLRVAQKMEAIGRLAGGVAHDLNNALTVIFTFGGFLVDELPPQSATREDAQEILHAAKKASRLTAQLLAFSRQKQVTPRVVDLNAHLVQLRRMVERVMGEHIAQEWELDDALENVRLDPDAFEQVFLNMAINARDAMPEGGTFRVVTSNVMLDSSNAAVPDAPRAGRYVSVALSDTGLGMDAVTKAQIFEPFFTTKGPNEGTGLGLAMCYGIIKQAGGHIDVRSELGRGATFDILVPRVAESVDSSSPASTPKSLVGSESILLVEDEEQLRSSTARSLRAFGYDVACAANGREALAVAAERDDDFALLITDMVMPEMGGAALTAEWGRRYPKCRILLVSGHAEPQVRSDAHMSTHEFLEKPFTRQELAQKIRQTLDA